MTKEQRKKHYRTWLFLMVLLPLGIITAWLIIPDPPADSLLQPPVSAPLPVVVRSIPGDGYTLNLRKDHDTALQLEWVNHEALAFPTALIYLAQAGTKEINDAELIGRIEARGVYRFNLRTGILPEIHSYTLIVYDFIHHQTIHTIKL